VRNLYIPWYDDKVKNVYSGDGSEECTLPEEWRGEYFKETPTF